MTASYDRLEAELSTWLRGLEPGGTPPALRLRTFADLRAEAERPHGRLARLAPALSAAASLGSIVLLAFMLMLLAVAGASVSAGAGGAIPAPSETVAPAGCHPSLLAPLILVAASVVAGGGVFVARLRRRVARLVFGGSDATVAPPVRFRRPWRTLSRWTWALTALTAVTVLLTIRASIAEAKWIGGLSVLDVQYLWKETVFSFLMGVSAALMPLAVAWRYPARDRSSVVLLSGSLLLLLDQLLSLALLESHAAWWPDPRLWILLADYVLPTAGILLVAAGLACRAGFVRRPPLRLAALACGGTFFVSGSYIFDLDELYGYACPSSSVWTGTSSLNVQLDMVFAGLWHWLTFVAWLAIMWVGISAVRSGRSRSWLLVLAGGFLEATSLLLLWLAGQATGLLHRLPVPGTLEDLMITTVQPAALDWYRLATVLAVAALLAALLTGLRATLPPEPEESAVVAA